MARQHQFRKTMNGEAVLAWDNTWIRVHSAVTCSTKNGTMPHCMIHKPSPTRMAEWRLHWERSERRIYRVCDDDHFHLDPDDLTFEYKVKGISPAILRTMITEHLADCDCQCCSFVLQALRAQLLNEQQQQEQPTIRTKGPRLVFGSIGRRLPF